MKSKTRLDSAVFQLTPTRTRYDLVIIANGKTEKIGSGLLNPFLSHLKTAQDQIAKGGYSITLEPDPSSDTTWFKKGTMERFVRFVSTPEVLERVDTIESEILQIEESIAIQSSDNLGIDIPQKKVDDYATGSMASIEGSKPGIDADADTGKAIVLYKPEAHPRESKGPPLQEESSKVQLLKVLENRKAVLQKEQGMAFARAVAAGFDMDHIADLISFGECFGATRLMDACLNFVQLWKEKHETGQWLDLESAEAMSNRSDISMNASGTMISVETKKQNNLSELGIESNGKATVNSTADWRPPLDTQVPASNHEYFQGQFQRPMFPQWPTHSPPGAPPVFQAYPMQGMPYYQNYPSGHFFQQSYPPMEDPRFSSTQKMGLNSHSTDSKDSNTESEASELGFSRTRSKDVSELEKEDSQDREQGRKAGRSGKKQSGMVVIRNINYITSNRKNTSGSDSESASEPETGDDTEDMQFCSPETKNNKSWRTSKNEGNHSKSTNIQNPYVKDDSVNGHEEDGGSWQAFQKCLLRDNNEEMGTNARGMLSMEKEGQVMRRKKPIGSDPIHSELMTSGGGFGKESIQSKVGVNMAEIERGRGGYRRETSDDFMIARRETQLALVSSQSDPVAENVYQHVANNMDRRPSNNVGDESFVVPLRSSLQDQVETNSRTAYHMDAEYPSELKKTEASSFRVKGQVSYEPNDLSLMPERGIERESIGYDLSVDYEMQLQTENIGCTDQNRNQEDVADHLKGSKKLDKDKKLKSVHDGAEKRKMVSATRKGKTSKFSPSNEAQARAEKLRAFKADLQKMKKEKEEEEAKRLEALKRERQKRIAARGNSSPAQSLFPSGTKPRLPTKLSPSAHRGSKFSDSVPGSSSPLQRLPIRTASIGSNGSEKIIKTSRLNKGGQLAGNGLSRSVSSLPELKKEKDGVTPEPKVTMARIRRLSEPKTINKSNVSSVKSRSSDLASNSKPSDGPEVKKISAIVSLDRTKAATLPELKIKVSKGPLDVVHKRSATKDLTQKANGGRSSVTPGTAQPKGSNEVTSFDSHGDDNPVIEKTVLMLDCEKSSLPVIHGSEESMERKSSQGEAKANKLPSEYAKKIHAHASPHYPSECQLDRQPSSQEVTTNHAMEELTRSSSIRTAEKQYQAPYARASSLDDPCTANVDYIDAPLKSTKTATNVETTKVYALDFGDTNSLEESPESLDKVRGKESSKGFRRLLKFGKKNLSSSAGESVAESEKLSNNSSMVDNHVPSSTAFEVHTLKNLISQDETPTAASQQKASRSFSLLSPFRSKTSEKKLAM